MAIPPVNRSDVSQSFATPVDRNASALLACLRQYAITAAPESDSDSEHARETQRLVALLADHLSAPTTQRRDERGTVPGAEALTRREVEVLDAIADGLSTMEIARVLHISVNTARNHVQRILEKLGVHSRLQAVNVAARHGLLRRLAG